MQSSSNPRSHINRSLSQIPIHRIAIALIKLFEAGGVGRPLMQRAVFGPKRQMLVVKLRMADNDVNKIDILGQDEGLKDSEVSF